MILFIVSIFGDDKKVSMNSPGAILLIELTALACEFRSAFDYIAISKLY